MIIEELIERLQKYPLHYTVRAVVVHPEDDDDVADFVDVLHNPNHSTKKVYVELDSMPSP